MADSDTSADVDALQRFMLWAREQGFAFDTITVGGVQLVGARDLMPTVKVQAAAAAAEQEHERASEEPGSIYDQVGRGLPGYEAMRRLRPE